MRQETPAAAGGTRFALVAFPFFASGAAALIYQLCWQRLLFVAFGVDLESITIIVSAFMLGLGVGALAGGRLADRFPRRIVGLFAAAELAIALFGLLSPELIAWVGAATVQHSLPVIAGANFLLLLVPTALMGATLPMLTAFLFQETRNVGVSVGSLYGINTLGAAVGAFATGFILFCYLDLAATIRVAVALNLGASLAALLLSRLKAFRGAAR